MAKFRIKRYNPEKQAEPYYEEFDFDIPEGATLLDCLNQIKWHPLKGRAKNRWSIWVSGNWRLTFEFRDGNVYVLDYEDYH